MTLNIEYNISLHMYKIKSLFLQFMLRDSLDFLHTYFSQTKIAMYLCRSVDISVVSCTKDEVSGFEMSQLLRLSLHHFVELEGHLLFPLAAMVAECQDVGQTCSATCRQQQTTSSSTQEVTP